MLLLRLLRQLLQVLNQVVELRHLDISLDHVRGVQVANRFLVLLDSLFVVPLRVELVCVLLADLSDNIVGEVRIRSNFLCLLEKSFFHQSVDFDVDLHLVKFAQDHLLVRVLSQVVHCVVLNFDLHDAGVRRRPVRRDAVREIVNLQRRGSLFLAGLLRGARAARLKVH